MTQPKECAHPSCHCKVSEDQTYCSEACKAAADDAKCPCGHPGC